MDHLDTIMLTLGLMMVAASMVMGFWFLAKKQPLYSFVAILIGSLIFLVEMFSKNGMTPTCEQLVCWFAALVFVVLSLKFVGQGKLGESFVIVLIAALSFFCGLSGVQGLLKTGMLSTVTHTLVEYGEKISAFQTNIDNARLEIESQQTKITNQFQHVSDLENKLALAQSDIDSQVQTNAVIQKDLAIALSRLEAQQKTIANVEDAINQLYSKMHTEIFDGADSDHVYFIVREDNSIEAVFRLKFSAVANSLQGMQVVDGIQTALLPFMSAKNLAISVFATGTRLDDMKRRQFFLTYIRDANETNVVLLC